MGSFLAEARDFFFSQTSRPAQGLTQPPIKWLPTFFPLRNEAEQLPECSAKIKNERIYTCAPPYVFIVSTGTSSSCLTMTVIYLWKYKICADGIKKVPQLQCFDTAAAVQVFLN